MVTPRSHLMLRKKAQAASNLLEGEKNVPKFYTVPNLTAQTSAMTEDQCKDSMLGLLIPFICKGIKPKGLVI